VASPRGKNEETNYRRYYRYHRYFKSKILVYGPSLLTSHTASHRPTQTTQYFGNYHVTHFRSPFYGPVHACRSAQRAINNICRSLGVPVLATGIRLRHEYAKHAFYDTWTQVYRRLTPPKEPSRISLMYLIFPETRIIHLHFAADSLCLSFFSGGRRNFPQDFSIFKEEHIGPSRSSKVTAIGTNQKRLSDFLLVRNSYFGPILHRFWARTRFMCSWPHHYLTAILGVFPLHQIADVGRRRAYGA